MTVVTFGELMLRLSPPGEERLLESPVLHTNFGGAEANVAVALRHLGVPSSYITRLPKGPLGDAALDALRHEGVHVGRVLRGGSRLGLYFVEPGADLRTMRVVYDRAGRVQVVDRVGGGDSFAAGLIAALLAAQSPQDAVEFAAAAGALKLGQAGDFGRSTAADVGRLVDTVRCT